MLGHAASQRWRPALASPGQGTPLCLGYGQRPCRVKGRSRWHTDVGARTDIDDCRSRDVLLVNPTCLRFSSSTGVTGLPVTFFWAFASA